MYSFHNTLVSSSDIHTGSVEYYAYKPDANLMVSAQTCNKALFTPQLWSIERKICMDEGIKKKKVIRSHLGYTYDKCLTVSAMLFNAI